MDWLLQFYIVKCFEQIDHDILLNQLLDHFGDENLDTVELINDFLKTDIFLRDGYLLELSSTVARIFAELIEQCKGDKRCRSVGLIDSVRCLTHSIFLFSGQSSYSYRRVGESLISTPISWI